MAVGNNYLLREAVKSWKSITAVAVENNAIFGLRKDGTVLSVSEDDCCLIEGSIWENISKIASGRYHMAAVDKNGTLICKN